MDSKKPSITGMPICARAKARSGFKTSSKAQWLRYIAHCNAHVLRVRSASNARYALPLSLIQYFQTTSKRSNRKTTGLIKMPESLSNYSI
jgi:hypothetical protein